MFGDHEEHRPFEDFAVRHVMGSLDEVESGAFRSHLLDCLECRARVGELRSIASDLAEVERVERRDRAAQRVETKEREIEAPEMAPEDPRPPRGGRVLVVVGILLIMVLSIWNFLLRGQNETLREVATAHARSAEAINFGQPWTGVEAAARHEGVARLLDDQLAVMVRGTDDGAIYHVRFYDADGTVRRSDEVESNNRQVRWFGGPLDAGIVRVDVTRHRTNGETIVFRALATEPVGP